MICAQPPLDVWGIVNNCCCHCLCCRLLGGRGLAACVAVVVGMDGNDNLNGNCLSKKRVGQGKRRGGIERWIHFFMLSYFVIVFWLTFFNAGWLISYQDQVNYWMGFSCKISLSVVQIWSSHFCYAIIVWESIVVNSCSWHWHETGLQTFWSSLLISYWLLGLVFAS